jgi:hypothetical protein
MSAAAFARNLDGFCAHCLHEGLALNISSHVARQVGKNLYSVRWASASDREFRRVNDLDLKEYLDCIRAGDFSLLLLDGGILQVSATFDEGEIIESRFYYIPCPVRFEKSELEVGGELYPLEDFIDELSQDELKERLCIRAPFRFELDPSQAREGHPLNHVHIGPSSSRIPLALSMCWDTFSRFVFKNFYPTHFPVVSGLLQHPAPYRPKTIGDGEKYEIHVSFEVKA